MKLDFIIPHFHCNNSNEQLLVCTRTIKQNFPEHNNIFVVGDVPPWLNVNSVPLARHRSGFGSKFVDQQKKLLHCLKTQKVTKNFIWCDDDVFFINPTSLEDIQDPYVEEKINQQAGRRWRAVLELTFKYTHEKNNRSVNFETHLPTIMETKKAIEMLEEIGDHPVHIKSAYFNMFPGKMKKLDETIKRIRKNQAFDNAKIINTSPESFEIVKEQLLQSFNTKSELEN